MKAAGLQIVVGLALWAGGAQAQAPAARTWQEDVRCVALMERTPDMMLSAAKLIRSTVAPTPEMRTMQASMAKAMIDSAPVMREAAADIRGFTRDEARRALGGKRAEADEVFNRALEAARKDASRFQFRAAKPDEAEVELDAFKAEMERHCPSKPAGTDPAKPAA
jgi:hypothetical protein